MNSDDGCGRSQPASRVVAQVSWLGQRGLSTIRRVCIYQMNQLCDDGSTVRKDLHRLLLLPGRPMQSGISDFESLGSPQEYREYRRMVRNDHRTPKQCPVWALRAVE